LGQQEVVIMKSLLIATATVALLAAAPAVAQGNKTGQGASTSSDAKFVEHVARDGQAEVDLGRLGEQKAQGTEVKALARRLVADHTKSNQQLMKIAQQEGAQPSAQPSKSERNERAKLEKLNGQAFDKAFVKQIVQDHQKDIKYFEKEQGSLKDPQLKSFAQQTLPVLREHLQMAQQTEQATSGSGSSTGRPSSMDSTANPAARTTTPAR
jgi:putative membrane protein